MSPIHPATRLPAPELRDFNVLDEILDNETELPIEEHTTDTAGYAVMSTLSDGSDRSELSDHELAELRTDG